MEIPTYRQCVCGALVVAMGVAGVVTETCEHGVNASACPVPRVEFIHTDYPEPQGSGVARAPYVLGTGTGPATMRLNPVRFGFQTGNITTATSVPIGGTLS
jgi:hypothetical protein